MYSLLIFLIGLGIGFGIGVFLAEEALIGLFREEDKEFMKLFEKED